MLASFVALMIEDTQVKAIFKKKYEHCENREQQVTRESEMPNIRNTDSRLY